MKVPITVQSVNDTCLWSASIGQFLPLMMKSRYFPKIMTFYVVPLLWYLWDAVDSRYIKDRNII